MTDVANRNRVQAGVPTGGQFATEARGENLDLDADFEETDFDEIADAQGWDTGSCLRVTRSFISEQGLSEQLGWHAAQVARSEGVADSRADLEVMDFDEIADMQGWDEISCLDAARDFVSGQGLSEQLGERAAEVAREENAPADPGQVETDYLPAGADEVKQLTPQAWAFGADTMIRLEGDNTPPPPDGFWEDNAANLKAIRDAGLRGPLTLRNDAGMWVLRVRLPHSGKDFGVVLSSPAYDAKVGQGITKIGQQVEGAAFLDLVGDKEGRIHAFKADDGSFRVYDQHQTRAKVYEPMMGNYYVNANAGVDYRDGRLEQMNNGGARLPALSEDANWKRLGEAMGVKGGKAKVEARIRDAIAGVEDHPDVVWLREGKR